MKNAYLFQCSNTQKGQCVFSCVVLDCQHIGGEEIFVLNLPFVHTLNYECTFQVAHFCSGQVWSGRVLYVVFVFQLAMLSLCYHCRPSVWSFDRASKRWEFIIPSFLGTQWLENFKMSEETIAFLCKEGKEISGDGALEACHRLPVL